MAKTNKARKTNNTSVGVKELKDRASELLTHIEKSGEELVITKNARPIAKVVPILEEHSPVRLQDLDIVSSHPQMSWKTFEPLQANIDSTPAIAAIIDDRSEK